MGKVKLIPELRFPGFEGEWKCEQIKQHVLSSAFGPRFSSNLYSQNGNIATLRTTDIDEDGTLNYMNLPLANLNINDFKEHILEKNDLVISRSGTIGVTGVFEDFKHPVLPGAFLIRFRFNINTLFPQFLKFYFNSQDGRNKLVNLSAGGVQKNLTGTNILELKQYLPSISEQTRIATYLTSVDKRISLLTQKKEKLVCYKQGVMQKIFSQELRFKDDDGKDFPEWEEKTIGKLGNTFNGLTGKTKEDFGKGKPYIQYMQIFSSSKININHFGFVDILETDNQNRVQRGDVFFTTSSETPNEIGTASVLVDEVGEVYLNSFCFGFRPNSLDELTPEFAKYLFRSKNVRTEIVKLAQGSTRYNMSKVELMKLLVSLPSNSEQQKIAAFLTALDQQIEKVDAQIGEMKGWKKGLLQKMFV